MNMRAMAIFAGLVALAVVSFFLADRDPTAVRTDTANLPRGYYLKNLQLQTTGGMGEIKYRLRAERADHDPVDGSTVLTNLALDYGNNENRWRFSAERGQMPKTNNTIALSGNVKAHTLSDAPLAATSFASDTLLLDIDGQTATTDDPVRIAFAHGTLDGVGLTADFANDRVTVRSEITGVFSPPTR